MAIKTNMSKAYDRMKWNFIEKLLQKMGFYEKLILWLI